MQYKMLQISYINANIAMITLNHPETMNALSGITISEMIQIVDELESNKAVRAVILTGDGKAFVAGADISFMSQLSIEEARMFSAKTDLLYEKIHRSAKIYIAAVNGFALGGGCELCLACDLSLASKKAKFGLPEVSLGILPGGGGTQRLCLRVGIQKAKELILTGSLIDAYEAEKIGLILRVVSENELLPQSIELAEKILKNGAISVKYAKECIQHCVEPLLLSGIEFENTLFGACFATEDQREGMNAFLEGRKPVFKNTF